MAEEKIDQRFRPIRGVLLDATIPVARIGADVVTSLQTALEKRKGKESTWSHAQVAVPKDKIDLKASGWAKTRLAIPLPGESWGTPSYRHGELHAHEAGPFLLVHRDESAPGAGLIAHLTKDVPEALRRRFSGKIAPFVQEKPMVNRELQKAAMHAFVDEYQKIADSTFTTSQYAGPMGTVPFQQASQLPAFRAPGLKAAIEKPQQKVAEDSGLATYGKHIALNAGQAVRDVKGTFSHPIAQYVAPEGGAKRLLSSVALSVPNIASDIYYGAVPPQLTHTKDELKGLQSASAGTWFRRGAGLEEKAAALRSGKLPPIFSKEKGVIGRTKQLLSGERALALKTYKERYENRVGELKRKADTHAKGGSSEYAESLRRDADVTGRAATRIGKIHSAEVTKSRIARGGVIAGAAGAGFAAGKASGEDKEAGALTPAGRLVATQRKGTGMGASVTGPSIAEVAKPPGIGHAMPGALKNQI